MQPYVVDRIVDSDGQLISQTEPTVVRQVISQTTSDRLNAILEQVVCDTAQGTGKNAYVAGYRIAGKTGTSEKVAQDAAGGNKEYIVSFIGYAPADDPQVICLVLMDTPSTSTGVYISGGQMAAPVVGKIFSDVLPYLGLEPEYTQAESMYLDRAAPDVRGQSTAQAERTLSAVGFSCRTVGTGGTVTDQLPLPGTVTAAGTTLILYAGAEVSPEAERVPDMTGMTYAGARDLLGSLGLFARSDGTILADSEKVLVAFQSVPAGTELSHGGVVELTLVNNDDETSGIY